MDIVLVPAGTILIGSCGNMGRPFVVLFMNWFWWFNKQGYRISSFPMGIIVSTLMGIALTAPISNSLAITLGLEGLAARSCSSWLFSPDDWFCRQLPGE